MSPDIISAKNICSDNPMKGIIVDYKFDKGFGFIMDQNKQKRFFHLNDIIDKGKFLNNIEDYLYTDYYDRICYVVFFNPAKNKDGKPKALNIFLSDQIFNDKSINTEFQAELVNLFNDVSFSSHFVSGVKKGSSTPLDATAGGNGTFRIGYPESSRNLFLHFRRIDDIGWGDFEVRDLVLDLNERSKITAQFLDQLKNHLIGKLVTICQNNANWVLKDNSILII